MESCQNLKEALMLDAFGELEPQAREALEVHLSRCSACRQEKKRIQGLLEQTKGAMTVPSLSRENSRVLFLSIRRRLDAEQDNGGWRKRLFARHGKLVLAMSTACLLIIALGWFSVREFRFFSPSPEIAQINAEERMILRDLEIIKNLELLAEMDTIEKLARQVDGAGVI